MIDQIEKPLVLVQTSGVGVAQSESFAGLKLTVDLHPAVAWAPVADPDPAASWGAWEFWVECEGGMLPNGTLGVLPTGHFLAWNRETGARWNFIDPTKAETFCVFWNGHAAQTRMTNPFKGSVASELAWEDIAPAIQAEMDRLETPAPPASE